MAPSRNLRPFLAALVAFLLATALAATLIGYSEQSDLRQNRARVAGLAIDHARALELGIERALSATYALAAMVRQGDGNVANFEVVAEEMLSFYPGVAAMGLSPGGVVKYVMPLAGNEKSVGFDQLNDPALGRRPEWLAIRES